MSKISNPTKVITGVNTRWSYANVWDAKSINGGTPKYSVSLIIPNLQMGDQCTRTSFTCFPDTLPVT